jgi:hypothetical protein
MGREGKGGRGNMSHCQLPVLVVLPVVPNCLDEGLETGKVEGLAGVAVE